ncbi:MAG TPA: sigma-70 family RNA polymerase sigma factor [Phycisphaerae bacterium]|nr:sigma-70 family RNA polymerase sigma factor [Phycisphaerae bacterium]
MKQTLEQVYRDHRQGLYTLALAITRRPEHAEDAVQDAFARLWTSDVRLTGDPVPYVFAAVRNAAVDQMRRKNAAARQLERVSIYNGLPADPALQAVSTEEHQLVREAIDALPGAEREALVMKIYAGLTFDQIARALGDPLQTVASRYRRALGRLGRQLKGNRESSDE